VERERASEQKALAHLFPQTSFPHLGRKIPLLGETRSAKGLSRKSKFVGEWFVASFLLSLAEGVCVWRERELWNSLSSEGFVGESRIRLAMCPFTNKHC